MSAVFRVPTSSLHTWPWYALAGYDFDKLRLPSGFTPSAKAAQLVRTYGSKFRCGSPPMPRSRYCSSRIPFPVKTTPVVVIVLLVVSVAASVAQTTRCSQSSTPGCNSNLRAADFGTLPLTFEANRGQVDPRVSYVSRGRGYTIFLTDEASLIKLQRRIKTRVTHTVITTRFVGQRPDAPLSALEPLDSRVNYLVGDRALWRTDIPEYGRVQRTGIYPGIDLVYYGKEGQLEYDRGPASWQPPCHG
jgi:hypothetical protein